MSCQAQQKKAARCAVRNGISRTGSMAAGLAKEVAAVAGAVTAEAALRSVGSVALFTALGVAGGRPAGEAFRNALAPGLGAALGGAVGNQVGGPGGALIGQVAGGAVGWGRRGQVRRAATRSLVAMVRAKRGNDLLHQITGQVLKRVQDQDPVVRARVKSAAIAAAGLALNRARGSGPGARAAMRAADSAARKVLFSQSRLLDLRQQQRADMAQRLVAQATEQVRDLNKRHIVQNAARWAAAAALSNTQGRGGKTAERVTAVAVQAAAQEALNTRWRNKEKVKAAVEKAVNRAIKEALN